MGSSVVWLPWEPTIAEAEWHLKRLLPDEPGASVYFNYRTLGVQLSIDSRGGLGALAPLATIDVSRAEFVACKDSEELRSLVEAKASEMFTAALASGQPAWKAML